MKKKIFITVLLALLFAGILPSFAVNRTAAVTVSAASKVTYRNKLRTVGKKIYYYNSKGKIVKNCWKTIKGKRYYFTKDGSAATAIAVISGKRYIFSYKGVLQKSRFCTISGKKYYVNSSGRLCTGWKTIKKKRYHFSSAGIMQTGWYKSGSKTYYLAPSTGAMVTGWKTIGGKKYYFNSSGVMQKKTWIGTRYVNASGVYDPSKKLPLANLQKQLKSAMKSCRGTWSIYVKNLDTNESFTINNRRVYAASLIKLYAMSAAYERIKQGKFKESSVKSTISAMITVSDNTAFNTIVRKIGTTYINSWCKANGYTGTNQGHGLSPSSNNYGLSNGTGSNVTTVADCGKLLESIYRGTCVSKSASSKMLGYLKKQTRRSKIPAGVPKGVKVANKTGETDDTTHDAAIVYSKGATYILVVMGDTPGSGWSSAANITKFSKIVYNYFN